VKPSFRPQRASTVPPSDARPIGRRGLDSGPRLFLGGRYYYRQVEDLAVNLCAVKSLTDDDWREYLHGSLAVSEELGHAPCVSLIAFTGAPLNAGQRRLSAKFMEEKKVRPIERVAILTENELLRGAMTAFGWLMPNLKYRTFSPKVPDVACAWLLEVGRFDLPTALTVWKSACEKLSVGW
jgi:SpoIIAA-like